MSTSTRRRPLLQARQLARIAGFEELPHEVGGPERRRGGAHRRPGDTGWHACSVRKARDIELQQHRVMHQAIDRRGRRHLIAKDPIPLREDEIAGDADERRS
jgi:hypothetical protein